MPTEAYWRARWEADGIYVFDPSAPGERCYNLVEFPYPSAEGLHVGHVRTYCGADAWGRYQRMRGRNVLQPIGFDAFGIHAENYARARGIEPAELTASTVENYRRQLREIGCGWDWTREIVTSDPSYYTWTQWVFLRLYDAGLAYRAEAPVQWCPGCETVLANEQVDDGRCERCDSHVIERVLTQWFLRTTAYADQLRDGLETLDWPEWAKKQQRDWIAKLRDWLISRQRSWGSPIPIVYCESCGEVPAQLPVLMDAPEHVPCPRCGRGARREVDVADTFLESSWYFLRYPFAGRTDVAWEPGGVFSVDRYDGGPEHVCRHHLYARFMTRALHDLGLVPFTEPFPRIEFHGMITRDGAKMSKSRGNVVSPDGYVRRYGADALRLALLFSGPGAQGGDFSDRAVDAMARFLERIRRVAASERDAVTDDRMIDRTIVRVGRDIEAQKCNTAIAALMEYVRWMQDDHASSRAQETLVLLLAPFAPFTAEDLWPGEYSVHQRAWPEAGDVRDERVTIGVQVDGRLRATIDVPAGATEQDVIAAARAAVGAEASRAVYVPGRIVNFVT